MQKQDFYRELFDNLSTGLVVTCRELRVEAINAAAQSLLECSESRCLDADVELLLPGGDLRQDLARALAENAVYTRRQLDLQLSSGNTLQLDLIVTPYHGYDGTPYGLILEFQPVERLLRINREGSQASAQENTRALVRGLAHEIKNPLGGLRGAAQLLARELPDSELAEYTNIIIDESDRLRDLVDRLLGPSKRINPAPANVHEIIEHVRHLSEAETGDAVTYLRDYDPSLPGIVGDRSQLIQAVLNIMRNAVQATEGNEGPRLITLVTRAQRQFTINAIRHRVVIRVDIGDNGPGIPPELEHSLFVPTISGRAEGSGLGLSIARDIINRHGGTIEFASEPGETVFSLFLPLEYTYEQN
jgi:two-component system nitrogen regulation sensor histidine kinase GlnL